MPNLRLPIPDLSDDDAKHKREKRGARRSARRKEDLASAPIPAHSCSTCAKWRDADGQWGECDAAVVVATHVSAEKYPPNGLDAGVVVGRADDAWWYAMAFGKATRLRTHRTFVACFQYEPKGADSPVESRPRITLLERVRTTR